MKPKLILLRSWFVFIILWFTITNISSQVIPSPSSRSMGPFGCPSEFYFSEGELGASTISAFNPGNVIHNYPFNLNALGYNPLDDYIYGIKKPTNELIKFHGNGTFDNLGNLGGAINISAVVGGFDDKGKFYIREGNSANPTVVVIDVANLTTSVQNSGSYNAKDWAYVPKYGKFFGVDAAKLESYTPGGGFNSMPLTGIGPTDGPVYGSAFYASDGFIYVVNNITTNLYRINIENLTAHLITTFNADQGDATSCPNALPPYPIVYGVSDTVCLVSGVSQFSILTNDNAINTTLNYASFSVLEQPKFGTVTYDQVSRAITYTPSSTPKDDVLKYQICNTGTTLVCDYAYVYFKAPTSLTFNSLGPFCQNSPPDVLPSKSLEGISGTWSPSIINTSQASNQTYLFTAQTNTCVNPSSIQVNIIPTSVPTFDNIGPFCVNAAPTQLLPISKETIAGLWQPPTISTNIDGNFTYTFTPDAIKHPCAEKAILDIKVEPFKKASFNDIGPLCQFDNQATLPVISTENITGKWTPAIVNTSTVGTSSYTFIPDAGLFPCALNTSLDIEIKAPKTIDFNAFGPFCQFDNQAKLPPSSIENVVGTWSPVSINTSLVGSSTYTFTPDPILHFCTKPYQKNIEIEPLVQPTFSIPNKYCHKSVPLILPNLSTEGIAGTWNVSSINTDQIGSSTYTFTPYASEKCVVTTSISIEILAPISVTVMDHFCSADLKTYDQTIEFKGGLSPYTVTNDKSNKIEVNGNSFTIKGVISDQKVVITAIDQLGCSFTFDILEKCECPFIPAPSVLPSDTICFGEKKGKLSVSTFLVPLQVTWYDKEVDGNIIGVGPNLINVSPGTYYAQYSNMVNGCYSSRTQVNIYEYDEIKATTSTSICDNIKQPFDLKLDVIGGAGKYFVSTPNEIVIQNNLNEFIALNVKFQSGAVITVTDRQGCKMTKLISPIILPSPKAEATSDKSYICTSKDTFRLVSNTSADTYNWQGPNGNSFFTKTATTNLPGQYILKVTNSEGCSDLDTLVVSDQKIEYNIASRDTDCSEKANGWILVSDILSASPVDLFLDQKATPMDTILGLASGKYAIEIKNQFCSEKTVVTISKPKSFTLDLGDDKELILGQSYVIPTLVSIPLDSITTIDWTPNEGLDCSDCLDPTAKPTSLTTYQLTLITQNGCTATDRVTLTIKSLIDIELPNIISLSSTNGNNLFSIADQTGISKILQYDIYDRWGNMLHTARDFDPVETNNFWNGKINGEVVVQGVYVYFVNILLDDGQTKTFKGDLTVIK